MINIIFTGDFAPLLPDRDLICSNFNGITGIINSADLHVTNLESCLTYSQKAIDKSGPAVKSDPGSVSLLNQAKVTLACLANNHIFDYGEKGVVDTLEVLKKSNIESVGIVNRTDGRETSIVIEVNNKKIGFLNYCEHEFSVREKGLLGASGYDPVNAYYDIRVLRLKVDWLIVIYHGGNEYYPLPRPELKRDFHYLADLGADLVVGHHTHVFSGYEVYNGKPLVYSLGNFFFPYEGEPESWNEGVLLNCIINESIHFELIPIYQCKDGLEVILMDGEKKESALRKIKDLSSIIADDSKLEEAWRIYVQNTEEGLTRKILYPTKVDKLLLKIPILKKHVSDKRRLRSLINILRCTSLEQLLIDGLTLKQ